MFRRSPPIPKHRFTISLPFTTVVVSGEPQTPPAHVSVQAPASSRLEALFRSCFPAAAAQLLEQQVEVLTDLLDTADPRPEPGPGTQEEGADCRR